MDVGRTNIGKKLRFEIFKRDAFKCLYCGHGPPEVLLQVDHVIAVSRGGTNDPLNLVTSCRDCNAGKSNIALSQIPAGHLQTFEERQEKLAQIKAISSSVEEERKYFTGLVALVSDYWVRLDGGDPEKICINGEREDAVGRFVKMLPLDKIYKALDSAYRNTNISSDYGRFRYFCGACWHMYRED